MTGLEDDLAVLLSRVNTLLPRPVAWEREVPAPGTPYVMDFYCAEAKLCVEADGTQHALHEGYDAARDRRLRGIGIYTLRLRYDLIEFHGKYCIGEIQDKLEWRVPSLRLPPPLCYPAKSRGARERMAAGACGMLARTCRPPVETCPDCKGTYCAYHFPLHRTGRFRPWGT